MSDLLTSISALGWIIIAGAVYGLCLAVRRALIWLRNGPDTARALRSGDTAHFSGASGHLDDFGGSD